MAEVFLAMREDAPELPPVAIKVILDNLRDEPEFEQMLMREADLASRLHHPNVVRVLDHCAAEHYVAMEYVHGRPLRRLMRHACRHDGMDLVAALSIIADLARGLHSVHETLDDCGTPLGLVHRDVTPSNVLIDFDGVAKIADFGIAKATRRCETTIGGSLKGKAGYMSPEQCRCEPLDRRSDVWSLGVLLYELTVGQKMFASMHDFGVMGKVVRGEFAKPREIRSDFPLALQEIIIRATALEPEDRHRSARELLLAIEEFARRCHLHLSAQPVATVMREAFLAEASPGVPQPVADDCGDTLVWARRAIPPSGVDCTVRVSTPANAVVRRVTLQPIRHAV
jgi:serine/threonine-protein kinase